MKHTLFSLWLLLSPFVWSGCGNETSSLTQIVVEVDSDLSVPDEVDRITLSVDRAKADTAAADLTRGSVPRTLGLVHDGGPLGPFTLHASGWHNGKIVVEASLTTSFVQGKTVHVSIDLERACVDVMCSESETCSDGNCTPLGQPKDGGVVGDGGAPGAPTCSIEQPALDEVVQVGRSFSVRGSCRDETGAILSQGLSWESDVDGKLGTRASASVSLQTAGSHTLSLCAASPSDASSIGCAEVTITAVTKLFESLSNANVLGSVRALREGAGGVVFAASGNGRLYALNLSSSGNTAQIALDRPPLDGNLRDVFVDAAHASLYVATTSGLTACAYGSTGSISGCTTHKGGDYPSDAAYSVLRVTSSGVDRLLVGTDSGLFVPDSAAGGNSGDVRANERAVHSMAVDGSIVWLATDQGLYRYTVMSGNAMRVVSGPASNANWTAVAVGTGGSVWLGSASGVTRFTPANDSWTAWNMSDGLVGNQVNSVAVEQQQVDGMARDILWIGTSAGVSRFDPALDSFQSFTTADGLPSNTVHEVLIMADGSKLFATDAGVARYLGR